MLRNISHKAASVAINEITKTTLSREAKIAIGLIVYIYSPVFVALLAYPFVGPVTYGPTLVVWVYVMGAKLALAWGIMRTIAAAD